MVPPDTVTIVGQAVMFVAMLFLPDTVLFRISSPHFIAFHNCLPFVPMHRLILAVATDELADLAVVLVWLFACSGICMAGLLLGNERLAGNLWRYTLF